MQAYHEETEYVFCAIMVLAMNIIFFLNEMQLLK
jgi:hypothetical protein